MIAVDTNVLVRFLVGDHPNQSAIARSVFVEHRIAVGHTVLLEAEWVLRRSYKFARREIATAFQRLLGLRSVRCPRIDAVRDALVALEEGCDFADALHVYTADPGVSAFATFDRSFVSRARKIEMSPPVRLLRSGDRIEA